MTSKVGFFGPRVLFRSSLSGLRFNKGYTPDYIFDVQPSFTSQRMQILVRKVWTSQTHPTEASQLWCAPADLTLGVCGYVHSFVWKPAPYEPSSTGASLLTSFNPCHAKRGRVAPAVRGRVTPNGRKRGMVRRAPNQQEKSYCPPGTFLGFWWLGYVQPLHVCLSCP